MDSNWIDCYKRLLMVLLFVAGATQKKNEMKTTSTKLKFNASDKDFALFHSKMAIFLLLLNVIEAHRLTLFFFLNWKQRAYEEKRNSSKLLACECTILFFFRSCSACKWINFTRKFIFALRFEKIKRKNV